MEYNENMDLNSKVSVLTGVGPVFVKLLAKLDIYTVRDLLYHFPFRYDDYSNVKKINDLVVGEVVTFCGTLRDIKNIFTKNGKRLTRALVNDASGSCLILWFNQHYLIKTLKPGQEYAFSGKVQLFDKKLCILSPSFEEIKNNSLNHGRLVPVYPETSGINSKWLRSKINDILQSTLDIPETLPERIREKEEFTAIKDSLNLIHFPDTLETARRVKFRFAYEELFSELLRVEHRKHLWQDTLEGVSIQVTNYLSQIDLLKKSLPFNLSSSQVTAIEDIFSDLGRTSPMNRLLEGDVGSGKTIVAVFGAYVSYLNGFRTLYMAPTEILATQHYNTFKSLLKDLGGPKIALATSKTKGDLGADILIGTHALLHTKEDLTNVGLVIVDEQHRFGVEQRSKIARYNHTRVPNLLTMSATPIPRTLTLTLYGDLSISHLETPENRVRTTVTKVIPEKNRNDMLTWIKKKGEQAFIVCPLIDESEHESLANVASAQETFKNLTNGVFAGISVGLLHGRMKPEEKAVIIEKFRQKEIQILVSTPVIEVGIDIPSATIIVIYSAERYGLASLHQLRGRVGRDGAKSYCLLFLSGYNPGAYKRLKYLEEETNGLKLAEIDLKMRGSGDVYGTVQSGYIKFKLADISDLEFLEKVKLDAAKCYKDRDTDNVIKKLLASIELEKIGNN